MTFLAYIDAGSGSLLLQMILAGALAVPFIFRRTLMDGWRRLRGDRAATPSSRSSTDPKK
jgi:hypothetical protein